MLYHLDAWLTRPPVPLRHRRSGVPLSLHSFGTLRAPPWRRTSPRKIPPTKPRHPELDSGSVPPIHGSLCFDNKVQKIPPTKPRHPELDSGSVSPSIALYRLARKSKKSLQQSPVTLNLIQGLYRHPCALYLLPRKPPLPEPGEGTFFQKKRQLQKTREYFKARLSGCPKMTWCNL